MFSISMEKPKLLSSLFDEKTVLVLQRILPTTDIFYLRDVSRESGVSLATTYRIVQKLASLCLVEKQIQGKFNYYKIIKDSPVYDEIYELIIGTKPDQLKTLARALAQEFGSEVQVFVDKKKGVLIVGDADKNQVNDIARNTDIKTMVVSTEQFSQMRDMGLISSEDYNEVL